MRRKDREVLEFNKMLELLPSENVMRLGLTDANGMYIVPVNYGFEVRGDMLSLFFHGATKGRKAEILQGGCDKLCFEIDGKHKPTGDGLSCSSSFEFFSILGNAEVKLLEDIEEKREGFDAIMRNVFKSEGPFNYIDKVLETTLLVRLDVTDWTCKKNLAE